MVDKFLEMSVHEKYKLRKHTLRKSTLQNSECSKDQLTLHQSTSIIID